VVNDSGKHLDATLRQTEVNGDIRSVDDCVEISAARPYARPYASQFQIRLLLDTRSDSPAHTACAGNAYDYRFDSRAAPS
jgi:hypothetical protein